MPGDFQAMGTIKSVATETRPFQGRVQVQVSPKGITWKSQGHFNKRTDTAEWSTIRSFAQQGRSIAVGYKYGDYVASFELILDNVAAALLVSAAQDALSAEGWASNFETPEIEFCQVIWLDDWPDKLDAYRRVAD